MHYDNLVEMVNYCENTNDCRRVLQLQYLGEIFDPQNCKTSGAPCDTCCKGSVFVFLIFSPSSQFFSQQEKLTQK